MEGKPVKPVRIGRWTANRKREILLEVLEGPKTIGDLAREHDIERSEVERFIALGTEALEARPKSMESIYQRELVVRVKMELEAQGHRVGLPRVATWGASVQGKP